LVLVLLQVYVTVHEAVDLKNMEVFGKMSPFVTLNLGGLHVGMEVEEKRTATHVRGGKTPTWDEAFVFPVNYGGECMMQLQLCLLFRCVLALGSALCTPL
jgi:hypothetical protein